MAPTIDDYLAAFSAIDIPIIGGDPVIRYAAHRLLEAGYFYTINGTFAISSTGIEVRKPLECGDIPDFLQTPNHYWVVTTTSEDGPEVVSVLENLPDGDDNSTCAGYANLLCALRCQNLFGIYVDGIWIRRPTIPLKMIIDGEALIEVARANPGTLVHLAMFPETGLAALCTFQVKGRVFTITINVVTGRYRVSWKSPDSEGYFFVSKEVGLPADILAVDRAREQAALGRAREEVADRRPKTAWPSVGRRSDRRP